MDARRLTAIPRTLLTGCIAVLGAAAGCGVPRPVLVSDPLRPWPEYPVGEAAAVYRTVLDTLYGLTEYPPMVILSDSTNLRISDCTNRVCRVVPPHKSRIERSTLTSFDAVSSSHRFPMRSDFGYRLPVVLVDDRDQSALTALGDSIQYSVRDRVPANEMPFWVGLQRKYPGAWGRTTLTPVGFNSRRTQALLQVHHGCGGSCFSYEDLLLEKKSGGWEVVERIPIPQTGTESLNIITIHGKDSADDYQITGPFRYLGADARMRREFFARQDSVRRAREDSLALERAPTRIRGTVRNARSGLPLPFAVIVSHTPPGDSQHRVISDSSGFFTLHNPRGGTMLEVRCPGGADRQGTTLAAPGLYAHAAIDTVVDIMVPDIAPCWPSRHIHRLLPGWFESAEARSATYPSGKAADVYRTVVDALYSPVRGKSDVVVLSNVTATRCVEFDDCGSPQLPRLQFQGVVDSATVRDFLQVSYSSIEIRPSFNIGRPTVLLTPAEREYLGQEGPPHESYGNDAQFWRAFPEAFPRSKGIVSLTRVGFNRDTTQALVEVGLDSAGSYRRPQEMVLLEKKRSGWRVVRRKINREVTSGAFRGGRCVPVSAPRQRQSARGVAQLRGEYVITRISTSRPRPPEVTHIQIGPNDRKSLSLGFGFDGSFKGLNILRIANGQFFGTWRSGFGSAYQVDSARQRMPDPFGYFCAIPAGSEAKRRGQQ